MKTIEELKRGVNIRMRKCWGESVAMFVISAGMVGAALFAWYLMSEFLQATDNAERPISVDMLMLLVTAVIVVVWLLIIAPYKYGSRWYRLQQVRGHAVHAKSIFSCYFSAKKIFKVYKLSGAVMLRLMVMLVPFGVILAATVRMIVEIDEHGQGMLYSLAVVFMLLLTAAMLVMYAVLNLKLLAVPYLFALGHDRPVKEILDDSRRFMKGNEKYMAEVARTMVMCLLPCVTVFPAFFLVPYAKMIYTAALNEIVENGFERDKVMDTKRGIRLEIGV